jgi:hypothetical protein
LLEEIAPKVSGEKENKADSCGLKLARKLALNRLYMSAGFAHDRIVQTGNLLCSQPILKTLQYPQQN